MAIKISGTTVIDDSFNIRNVGVVTATTFVGNLTGTATTTLSIDPSGYATAAQMVGLGTTASATTVGFSTITVVSSTGIVVGDTVVGPGIVVGTKVSGIAGTSVTLDTPVIVGIGTTSGIATPITFYSSTKVASPGIAGPGTAKAWVTYEGGIEGVFPGGATTVSRAASSTTATFTTTNNHGLIVNNYVYVKTGVVAGLYLVTSVAGPKTFTITTVASTLISAGTVATFFVLKINNSFNVGTVTNQVGAVRNTGVSINFASNMPSASYCPVTFGYNRTFLGRSNTYPKTSASVSVSMFYYDGQALTADLNSQTSVVVF